jgi:hypothetical protein
LLAILFQGSSHFILSIPITVHSCLLLQVGFFDIACDCSDSTTASVLACKLSMIYLNSALGLNPSENQHEAS